MPISDNPADYYTYYIASQRRVEEWVQETTRELQECSLSVPIIHSEEDCHTQVGSTETETAPTTRTTTTATTSGRSRKTTASPPPPPLPLDSADPSSPARALVQSTSRPSISSPSKIKKSSREHDRSSRSKTGTSSRKSRSATTTKLHGPTIYRYLPYGVLPILFALAEPSIPTVAAAVMLLLGYMCMDYEIQNPRSKTRTSSTYARSPSRSRRRRTVANAS